MRKLLFCIICLTCFGIKANAQRFGIVAGMSFSETTLRFGDFSYHGLKSKAGFNGGVIMEFPLSKAASVNTGLLYTQRGYRMDDSFDEDKYKIKASMVTQNLEIPVNMNLRLKLPVVQPFIQAGPYLMVALGGHMKEGKISEDIDFSGSDKDMKRVDFGFNMGAGADFLNFRILFNYGLGFVNMRVPNDYKMRNRAFTASLAYMF